MFVRSVLVILLFSLNANAADKVRIGWQVPWAVQGQLVQILKHTEIAKGQGLELDFVPRTYGPELNELALGGNVDVILTADQPAAALFSRSEDWAVMSRLMYNRTATYVPLKSAIKSVADLKGKTIGVPVGAAAQRITAGALAENKVADKDVTWVNLGIPEHMPLIKKADKNAGKWDQFDALSGFDPVPAILESEKLARIIHVGKVCAVIVVNKSWATKNPKLIEKLKNSFVQAYEYYQKNTDQADQWFMEEAKFNPQQKGALKLTTSLEPNLKSGQKISLKIGSDDQKLLQEAADFVAKTSNKQVQMKNFILPSALE